MCTETRSVVEEKEAKMWRPRLPNLWILGQEVKRRGVKLGNEEKGGGSGDEAGEFSVECSSWVGGQKLVDGAIGQLAVSLIKIVIPVKNERGAAGLSMIAHKVDPYIIPHKPMLIIIRGEKSEIEECLLEGCLK